MDEPNHKEDGEISRALTGGDGEIDLAIEQIYRKHGSRLYASAYARLYEHHAAQEAVHEVLIAVLKKARRGEWRVDIQIENFLNQVLKHKAIEIFRKRQRLSRHLSDRPLEEQKKMPSAPPDVVWEEMIEREKSIEESANFEEFISGLSGKQKMAAKILNEFLLEHGHRPTMQRVADEMRRRGDDNANKKSVQSIMRELQSKLRLRQRKRL